MALALVTATAAEMRAALAGLDVPPEVPERGAARAVIASREALLVVTGVGPVNAALEMGAALGRYDISGVVNLGVAGSFDLAKAPLESAVAASAEVYADYGVAGTDGLVDTAGFAFPQWEGGEGRVLQRMELDPEASARTMGLALSDGWTRGPALTVAGVTGSLERAHALAERHGALTESMEGFSLALACLTRRLPFLEVRTISNGVGERDRKKWKLKQALASLENVTARLFSGQGSP